MRSTAASLALLTVLACSCADRGAPARIDLARDVEARIERSRSDVVLGDGRVFRRTPDDEGRWLVTTIARDAWTFDPEARGGVWRAPISVLPAGRSAAGIEARLDDFEHAPQSKDPSVPWRFPPGSFATLPGRVLLKLEPGEEPPGEATLSVFAGAEHAGSVRGRRFSGDGFALEAGDSVRLTVDVPEGSALRFATTLEPAFGPPTPPRESVRFRVTVDGRRVFQHEEVELGTERYARHVVPLEGAGTRTITLEVEGGYAYSAFLTPRIAPEAVPRRPPDARPDIVVFLADTLRADALAVYGGELGVTPFLDELADDSLVFRRAWSTGTYTLPAHASMFTGVFPHQVGIVGTDNGVPEEMVTIAEHLRAHGYRTGAITDSVVVTQALGLAQGFGWFDELHATLGSTLQRARDFLDDDDGRPVFLFVQTYRTHLPYRVSRRTRDEWGERLGLEGDPDRLRARIQELVESPPDAPGRAAAITEALDRIERHYWGGVVDLDDGFRRFCEDLRARGLFDSGVLWFASDHGEAFGEHGAIYHRDKVWEVLARVPLLVTGRGIEPGTVDHAASLVDLPSTLAALAGVVPRSEWLGTPLLTLDQDRPAFVFECRNHDESTLAVVDGPRKVIGYERGERFAREHLLAAFDLNEDPAESTDVLPAGPSWPAELFGRLKPVLEELLVPLTDPVRARLSAERLDELRAMGYGGG